MTEEIIKKDGKMYCIQKKWEADKLITRHIYLGEYEEVEVLEPTVQEKPKKHKKIAQEPSQEAQEDVKSIEVDNGEGEIKAQEA